MTALHRDLGSPEHWHRSLERSRRRRALATAGRRYASRRKGASLALTAAVAAGPTVPNFALAEGAVSGDGGSGQPTLSREATSRVLVGLGDSGRLVVQVQTALRIGATASMAPRPRPPS